MQFDLTFICKVIHGSKLYQLDDENSDSDVKGIFLPSLSDCALLAAPENIHESNGKEGKEKVESQYIALQTFLNHAAGGQTIAVDMLHCADEDCILNTPLWAFLRKNKERFYTKKMSGMLGFSRSLALKYGQRADRLAAVERVLSICKEGKSAGFTKMLDIWENFPKNADYIRFDTDDRSNQKDSRFLEVAGKKLQATITLDYAIEILSNTVSRFGDRVQMAKEMGGADYKALSHSFRVAYQLRDIFIKGTFSYPLKESSLLRDIKYRKVDFLKDELDKKLTTLIDEVEDLASKANLPERVDKSWIDNVILRQYGLDKL